MHAALLTFVLLIPGQTPDPISFTDISKKSGLHEPLLGIMGHGGAWGDFDGDGKIDLFVGGFGDRPNKEYAPAAGPVPNRLFRNLGGGKFEPVKNPELEIFARTSGAVFADLDNDGWPELFVANNAKDPAKKSKLNEPQRSALSRHVQLFHNQKGTLVEISKECGACPQTMMTARNIGVFDYDGDGLLDLLIIEDRFTKKPRSTLFRNLGNLKFKDVNQEVGLPDDLFGLGLAVADVNGDGRPDFFVPHANRFFVSQVGKDGTTRYHEPPELAAVFAWKALDGEDWPCGAAFGDLNRDGKLELVLAIHGQKARNKVYQNEGVDKNGVPRFKDVTKESGLETIVPVRCPHVEIQDFDNDGFPDIYLSAAWLDEQGAVTPLIFRNQGVRAPGSANIAHFLPPKPIAAPMVYYPAGPSGDFDSDGRLDLFLINWFQGNHCRLLRNDSPAKNGWLQVRVTSKGKMNKMGIGCQVSVIADLRPDRVHAKLIGHQEVATGYGYASGQPALCHFGLGDVGRGFVEVKTPGGQRVRREFKANERMAIEVE